MDFYNSLQIANEDQTYKITQLVVKLYEKPEFFDKAEKEATILKKMYSEGISVPLVYYNKREFDYYIIIMERINGITLQEKLNQKTTEEELIQILENYFIQMQRIHTVKISNYEIFNDFKTPHNNYLNELVKFQYSYDIDNREHFKKLLNWIETNKQYYTKGKLCVIHNDFHLTNVIINSNNDVFVVDWTNLLIGDPMTDIVLAISSVSDVSDKFNETRLISIYERTTSEKLEMSKFNFYFILVWYRRLLYFYILLEGYKISDSKERNSLHFYLDILNNIAKKATEITGINLPRYSF